MGCARGSRHDSPPRSHFLHEQRLYSSTTTSSSSSSGPHLVPIRRPSTPQSITPQSTPPGTPPGLSYSSSPSPHTPPANIHPGLPSNPIRHAPSSSPMFNNLLSHIARPHPVWDKETRKITGTGFHRHDPRPGSSRGSSTPELSPGKKASTTVAPAPHRSKDTPSPPKKVGPRKKRGIH